MDWRNDTTKHQQPFKTGVNYFHLVFADGSDLGIWDNSELRASAADATHVLDRDFPPGATHTAELKLWYPERYDKSGNELTVTQLVGLKPTKFLVGSDYEKMPLFRFKLICTK